MINIGECWICNQLFSNDTYDMIPYVEGETEQSEYPIMHFVCPGEIPGEGILTCPGSQCIQIARDDIARYKTTNERLVLSDIVPSLHAVVQFWRPSKGWVQKARFDVPFNGVYSTYDGLRCKVKFQMDSKNAYGPNDAVKTVTLREIMEHTPFLCRQIHSWILQNPENTEGTILARALAFSQL